MGFSDGAVLIGIIKCRGSDSSEVNEVAHNGVLDRLAASVNTTPGHPMISMKW
jgi:hypothetical protein